MTTAEMMRAQIREQARNFDPVRRRVERRMTPTQRREKEIIDSWKWHLIKRVSAYRDIR